MRRQALTLNGEGIISTETLTFTRDGNAYPTELTVTRGNVAILDLGLGVTRHELEESGEDLNAYILPDAWEAGFRYVDWGDVS